MVWSSSTLREIYGTRWRENHVGASGKYNHPDAGVCSGIGGAVVNIAAVCYSFSCVHFQRIETEWRQETSSRRPVAVAYAAPLCNSQYSRRLRNLQPCHAPEGPLEAIHPRESVTRGCRRSMFVLQSRIILQVVASPSHVDLSNRPLFKPGNGFGCRVGCTPISNIILRV